MADVFISYARAEYAVARVVASRLESLGLTVFIDQTGLDGGDVFADKLDHEVKTAGAVLGLWSPLALKRPWVRVECDIGKRRGVLVPAAIEAFNELDVPAVFWNIQFIDLTKLTDRPDDPSWVQLVQSVVRSCGRHDVLEKLLHTKVDRALDGQTSTAQETVAKPQEAGRFSEVDGPVVLGEPTRPSLATPAAALTASHRASTPKKSRPIVGLIFVCFVAGIIVAFFATLAARSPQPGSLEWCKNTPQDKQIEEPAGMAQCLERAAQ